MRSIRAKDTKPEMIVRRWLWNHGFRYRLHVRKLAGSPDIVMQKHKIAIFINGCFWHGHNVLLQPNGELINSVCCKIPNSNRQYWLDKINRNMKRDILNSNKLRSERWNVLIIWECELQPKSRQKTLNNLLCKINNIIKSPSSYYISKENCDLAAELEIFYGSRNDKSNNKNDDTLIEDVKNDILIKK